jgi:hypothetical protein
MALLVFLNVFYFGGFMTRTTCRRWFAGALTVLAMTTGAVATGAQPAAASIEHCENLYVGSVPSPLDVIARLCIYWDGAPSGSAYTTTQIRIWNPTGNRIGRLWAIVRYNDNRSSDFTKGGVSDGDTYIKTETHVGTPTTKFEIESPDLSWKYCAYLTPNGFDSQVGHENPCGL